MKGNRRRICTSDLEKSIIFSTKQSQESLQNPAPSQDKVDSITSKNVGPSNKLLEPRCGTQRNMEGEAHPSKIIFWVVGREYCGWLEEDPTMWNTTGYTQWVWGTSQGRAHLNLYVLIQPSIIFCKILNRALSTTHFLYAARKYELRVGRYLCICSLLNLNTLTGAPWQRLTGAPKLFCCTTRFSLFPKS